MRIALRPSTLVLLLIAAVSTSSSARAQGTNPEEFTRFFERTHAGTEIALPERNFEVDTESLVEIKFDRTKMAPGKVLLRVEATLIREHETSLLEVDPYAKKTTTDPKDADCADAGRENAEKAAGAKPSTQCSGSTKFVFDVRPFVEATSVVPNATIDLRLTEIVEGDEISIKVINDATKESLIAVVSPRPLGFHVETSDSLLFVHRIGVRRGDLKAGLSEVNFAPAPGLSYGGIWIPRETRGHGFWRFLSPGIGLSFSFLDWKDPAFDSATGQFVPNTSGGDIGFGLGVQASLFNGILQVAYGWNLEAERRRTYWGLGVSFVDLTKKIGGLIGHKSPH